MPTGTLAGRKRRFKRFCDDLLGQFSRPIRVNLVFGAGCGGWQDVVAP